MATTFERPSVVVERPEQLVSTQYWDQRAQGGYNQLGWVQASGPLEKITELADLKGHETVVDIGTGSQAVLDALAARLTTGKIFGFDISADMMRRSSGCLPANATLLVADTYKTPFQSESVDLCTARMVYHNLMDIKSAVLESWRMLRPGGKLIVVEYVAADEDVWPFERRVFDIKEKGRNLWTGDRLRQEIADVWPSGSSVVGLDYSMIRQYSVKDWMGKSGLPRVTQEAVLQCYLEASRDLVEKMGITYTNDGDALVDRPFANVVATK